jgi:hypothetical protein
MAIGLTQEGARYLVIAPDAYVGALAPLVEWKTKKGVLAEVVPLSQTGSSPSQIQAYIRNAYNSWPVKPEYVLIAGSPSLVASYGNNNDCYYGEMNNVYPMEIPVGRLPFISARECTTLVAKTLAYERPPVGSDTNWYLKGTTTINEDSPYDPYYQPDSRLVRGWWQSAGYVLCESLSDFQGHSSATVNAAGRDGRAFLTHRGQCVGYWWPPFDQVTPNTWNNGAKMPITVSGSCETVTLEPGATMYGDQFVRAGTPQALGGAIAYFGTTMAASHVSDKRSACFRGFFHALFPESIHVLGTATLRGRHWVDSLFPSQTTRYWEWNLLGDPELNVWTSRPRPLNVRHDTVVPMVPQTYPVVVTSRGLPVESALVCLWLDTVVYALDRTDSAGQVQLPINPTHMGTMFVTVTGRNLLPYEGTARVVVANAAYLVLDGVEIEDYSGNGDSVPNPGEAMRIHTRLRNVGMMGATGVTALLRTADSSVVIRDSSAVFGPIPPDSTVYGDPFDVALDTALREGHSVQWHLAVRSDTGDTWGCDFATPVRSGRMAYVSAALDDSTPGGNGNGRLGKGESGRIRLALRNSGGGSLTAVSAVLSCADSNVAVSDSTASYGRAGAGETLAGASDRFAVAAGPNLPVGTAIGFFVRLVGDGGTYRTEDTFSFTIPAEQGSSGQPTGPDPYGYWCYDNTDTSTGRAPSYAWQELAPPGPGQVIPGVSDSNDVTRTLSLPFPFKLYGLTDSVISVCSNGFLALGVTEYKSGVNRPIPDTAGPPLMLAPFWDDLNPNENASGYGTAYQYYDTASHVWIVEYKDFAHYGQPSIREAFQVKMYDPAVYPTPTGDGEIEYHYGRVSLSSGNTVGIEDSTETRGLRYLYNNTYSPGAVYLQSGRALKFTTWPPRGLSQPWLILVRVRTEDTLHGNGNGIPEPGESLGAVVVIRNSGSTTAAGTAALLRSLDGGATVLDSVVELGEIPVGGEVGNWGHPFLFEAAAEPVDTVMDFGLLLSAGEYSTIVYFSIPLFVPPGIQTETGQYRSLTGLHPIRPNPLREDATVSYAIGRRTEVDLALFDASGRRVLTLARGVRAPGLYGVTIPSSLLGLGIYFCRLATQDMARPQVRKVQVVR